MAQLQIPTVTIEDLLEFQAKHFPQDEPCPAPDYSFAPPDDGLAEEEDFDDGLGYYPDGVKRTLTDEQIKIFRHSEIHALLRERQLQRERNAEKPPEPSKPSDPDSSPATPEPAVIEKSNLMKRKTDHADLRDPISSTQKRAKNVANNVKSANVTYEDIQYDEDERPEKSARSVGPSSRHPGFAGRRIISYDD
ncbi:hypothetical protein VTN77DRAFT_3490 [Rasamsonia byssochlamydoides]|uniref:uncharacterized protein n=1 Tax=Rasamsonia byssochlamydoides TaxID=89139 RepID=UPI0037430579